MKIGLIDLGSNTIKLEIFEICGTNFKSVFYDASYAYIITHIECRRLNSAGVKKIAELLKHYQLLSQNFCCDKLICFSTASLRQIDNQQEVLDSIYDKCGIKIIPITGEEEAYYNYLSMRSAAGDHFLGGDMGGGSMQLFYASNGSLQIEKSLPLGALKLYRQFVSGEFPSVGEVGAIKEFVKAQISYAGFSERERSDVLYFMGGSTRTISALFPGRKLVFSRMELESLLNDFLKDLSKARVRIENVCPERLQTILPAMAALLAVCEFFHVGQVHSTQSSVREGYLIDLLNRKECIGT